MNSPTLYPDALRIDAAIAEVEPFPFVPVTWMDLNIFWGDPSNSKSTSIDSTPGWEPRFLVSSHHMMLDNSPNIVPDGRGTGGK